MKNQNTQKHLDMKVQRLHTVFAINAKLPYAIAPEINM
jgi:hypothetical protein